MVLMTKYYNHKLFNHLYRVNLRNRPKRTVLCLNIKTNVQTISIKMLKILKVL